MRTCCLCSGCSSSHTIVVAQPVHIYNKAIACVSYRVREITLKLKGYYTLGLIQTRIRLIMDVLNVMRLLRRIPHNASRNQQQAIEYHWHDDWCFAADIPYKYTIEILVTEAAFLSAFLGNRRDSFRWFFAFRLSRKGSIGQFVSHTRDLLSACPMCWAVSSIRIVNTHSQ